MVSALSESELAANPTLTISSPRHALSFRTFALSCLIAYLFVYPISQSADIVASVLAFSLSTFIALVVISSFVVALRLRQRLRIQVALLEDSASQENLFARSPLTLELKTSQVQLPPMLSLSLVPLFSHEELNISPLVIVGTSNSERRLRQKITFPHRGRWTLTEIAAQHCDGLGLSSVSWMVVPSPREFRVRPAQVNISALPVISSAYRPGEVSLEHSERLGDPYDLKPYHPSDGLRKILWKTYAKSGQLIARHPERSVTPEGQTVIFCLARPEDDIVAGAALEYCRTLENAEIQLCFGCEGMSIGAAAHSTAEAESLLIDSVWASLQESETDYLTRALQSLLQQFRQDHPHANLSRLVLFLAKARFESQSTVESLARLGSFLANQGITPTFFVIGSSQNEQLNSSSPLRERTLISTAIDLILPWIVSGQKPVEKARPNHFPQFAARCGGNGWQLLTFTV